MEATITITPEWALIAWTAAGEPVCLDYRGAALSHHVEGLGCDVVDVLGLRAVRADGAEDGYPGQLLVWQGACAHGDPDLFAGELRPMTVEELADVIFKSSCPEAWNEAAAERQWETAVGICRVCGCTDDDCSDCVVATGHPCRWVAADLCSRCADEGRG